MPCSATRAAFALFLPILAQCAPTPYVLLKSPTDDTASKRDGESLENSPLASTDSATSSNFQQAHFSTDNSSNTAKGLMMAYYPDWAGYTFPPEKIDFKRFDWIDFAFAIPNEHFEITWDDPESPTLLRRLVDAAHLQGKKVKVSVGGATGSKYFSPAAETPSSREIFATNLLALYKEYSLDGIDLDWEYPGSPAYPGNIVSPSDTDNFLLFLQLLRSTLPSDARISAAAQPTTFVDANQEPMKDMSAFGSVLDWILIMNYDVWGSSSTPGPNAPMYDACHNSTQPEANAVSAYNAWTEAGFPASKIVLGLPSYSYLSASTASSLRQRSESNETVYLKADDADEGQIQFKDLVRQGALLYNDTSFVGAGGFTRYWDGCSSTPYLRSDSQLVSYDDPESLRMKAEFARKVGMLGVNIFDVHGDTASWDLTDGIRKGLGL